MLNPGLPSRSMPLKMTRPLGYLNLRAILLSPQDLILGAPMASRLSPSLKSRAVGGNKQGMVLSVVSILLTQVGRLLVAQGSSVFKKRSKPTSFRPQPTLWVGGWARLLEVHFVSFMPLRGAFEGQYTLDVIEALKRVSLALPLTSFETLGKVN